MERFPKKIIPFFIFCICGLLFPLLTYGADLSLLPSHGTYQVGQTFSVSIYLASTSEAVNASSGIVSFPASRMNVVSLSKNGSIFNLWVQEPSFSNNTGRINFEGVVLNPGFLGSRGKILTITFKATAPGSASLAFSNGSILANDGNGTELIDHTTGAQFSFNTTFPSTESATPGAPLITSLTHPDQNKWYSNNSPKFTWNISSDVSATKILYDKNPFSDPTILYSPAVGEKDLQNLADGVYYLHVQLRNGEGWGSTGHFRFQIDTQKPDYLNITEIPRQDATDPKARFTIDSKDSLSGIDHYEMKIDNGDWVVWQDDGSHIYETPLEDPGSHKIFVKALDKAGNFITNTADFSMDSLPAPTIIDYPKQLSAGDTAIIRGKSIPNVQVILSLQKDGGNASQLTGQSDGNGNFVFTIDQKLDEGIYKIWAQAIDSRGAKSALSDKEAILVQQPALFKIGSLAINVLVVAVSVIALVFLIAFLIFWSLHKLFVLRSRLKKEMHHAEGAVHKSFDLLREEVRAQIKLLDSIAMSRPLTEVEERIIKNLKKNLDKAEQFIRKEIHTIEKDVL